MKKKSKSVIPQNHSEVNMDLTPEGKPIPSGALNPMPGKTRPCTHKKTNECDH